VLSTRMNSSGSAPTPANTAPHQLTTPCRRHESTPGQSHENSLRRAAAKLLCRSPAHDRAPMTSCWQRLVTNAVSLRLSQWANGSDGLARTGHVLGRYTQARALVFLTWTFTESKRAGSKNDGCRRITLEKK